MAQPPTQRRPRLRVSAILEENEQVLLVPHYSTETGNRVWFLPGGDLPHGDLLRVTTERCVEEETGFHVRVTELRGIFEDVQAYRKFHSLCFIYAAKILGGELKSGPESTRPQWFDVHDCPSLRLYPPFSQWDNLIAERFSSQRWDGPDRMIGVVLDKRGQVLLCRKGSESRAWWPLRLELERDEEPRQALARLLSHSPQAAWPVVGEPALFPMRAVVAVVRLDAEAPIADAATESGATFTWTDPALLTTFNMDPAVRRLVYDALQRLQSQQSSE